MRAWNKICRLEHAYGRAPPVSIRGYNNTEIQAIRHAEGGRSGWGILWHGERARSCERPTPPEKRPVKERPLVPPLIDNCPMLKTITSILHPPRPVVPYTTSNPVEILSTLHVLTSANLVPCPHQPLVAWAMIKEQFTAFCLSLLPWPGPQVYRDGVTPFPP